MGLTLGRRIWKLILQPDGLSIPSGANPRMAQLAVVRGFDCDARARVAACQLQSTVPIVNRHE